MRCLVTGATRGIGLSVAHKLANAGHSVVLAARNKELLESRMNELPGSGHSTWTVDFKSDSVVEKPPADIDAFVNSAGITSAAPLVATRPAKIEEIIRINLLAPMILARALVRQWVTRRNAGSIVFLSSVLAHRGFPGTTTYGATKAGIEGFSRALAREVGSRHINVNCIAPGLVDTDMGRLASPKLMDNNIVEGLISPDAIADAVLFLLQSRHITGQTLLVDNGNMA